MIDYYAELNLGRFDSLETINKKLTQLECAWKERNNNPEEATKVLSLVLEAREHFSSETKRSFYETALANSMSASDLISVDDQRWYQYKKVLVAN